ncbi:hypothetical protein ACXWN6_10150, partial [Streptococcus pyogenes]
VSISRIQQSIPRLEGKSPVVSFYFQPPRVTPLTVGATCVSILSLKVSSLVSNKKHPLGS